MNVRGAPEVPDHVRPFELPDVPNPVVADVFLFVERHVHMIEAGGIAGPGSIGGAGAGGAS